MKVNGDFLARALHLKKKNIQPLYSKGTLLRLGDWARHRHAAVRQCAAAKSQEGLAPHQYFMFANVIFKSLRVCRMIMDNYDLRVGACQRGAGIRTLMLTTRHMIHVYIVVLIEM